MAHKRKDTYVKPPEWWKHLRPYNKKKVNRLERIKAKERIKDEINM